MTLISLPGEILKWLRFELIKYNDSIRYVLAAAVILLFSLTVGAWKYIVDFLLLFKHVFVNCICVTLCALNKMSGL